MIEDQERPLVTFALFAYNQEQFIREAVEGALNQDYAPLEIILSDDSSTDRTFEIMKEMAFEYTGTSIIVLNRNMKNLNIGGHINTVMQLAQGELVVVAAGDDISLPNRVTTLVKAWITEKRQPDLLCSDYIAINKSSLIIGEGKGCKPEQLNANTMASFGYGVLGATAAWTKSLWKGYNTLPENLVHEDVVMPFRAVMKGGIKYVQTALVLYRQNVSTWVPRSETTSPIEMQKRTLTLSYNAIITANTQIADATKANRLELIPYITKRLHINRIVTMIYRKKIGIFSVFLQSFSCIARSKPIVKALTQIHLPAIHKFILNRRKIIEKL